MASRALMFRRCRKHQRHVLILIDWKLADASNGRRLFAGAEPVVRAERSSEGECAGPASVHFGTLEPL